MELHKLDTLLIPWVGVVTMYPAGDPERYTVHPDPKILLVGSSQVDQFREKRGKAGMKVFSP